VLKDLIKKYFKYFTFFYSYLRNKILFVLILSIFVGLLDGIGLVFFLPMLSISGGGVGSTSHSESFGNYDFFNSWFTQLGIELTFGHVILIVLFVFILKNLVRYLEARYSMITLRHFVVKIRKEYIQLFRDFKYSAYCRSDSGRIQNIFTGGVRAVAGSYKTYLSTIQNGIMVLVYVVMASIANFEFALFVFVGALLTNFLFRFIYTKTKEISRKLTKTAHGFQGLLIQSVAFFKYLKSTGQIRKYSQRMEGLIDSEETYARQMGRINAFLSSVKEPIVISIMLLVVYLQVTVFNQSMMSIILSIMLFYRALSAMLVLQTNWNSFFQAIGGLEDLQDFKSELLKESEKYGELNYHALQKELFLQNVHFNYKGGETILKEINLTITKNQITAFVGESGSGKTTTVNLLAGLFEPISGTYLIDNIESNKIDIRQFQNRIGYITQEAIVFDDDIFNNVTFWDERTPKNLERFWEALRKASIDKFVHELADKENSTLGNNGVMVSGGQKQRISIARELYKDIDILIMDEATSALDSETEKAIQENIDALKGKYTIIIVAHRLSTIKNADQIVLMDKGKIVDIADFETLKMKNTYFARMVSMQEV
jgi:ABC-type multidrug transport system fused ATPase/permease subunit